MHGKHVTIVDVGRVVRIQNLIRYEANTGFSNAEKPVLKPNRKTGSSGFFHTGTQPCVKYRDSAHACRFLTDKH